MPPTVSKSHQGRFDRAKRAAWGLGFGPEGVKGHWLVRPLHAGWDYVPFDGRPQPLSTPFHSLDLLWSQDTICHWLQLLLYGLILWRVTSSSSLISSMMGTNSSLPPALPQKSTIYSLTVYASELSYFLYFEWRPPSLHCCCWCCYDGGGLTHSTGCGVLTLW